MTFTCSAFTSAPGKTQKQTPINTLLPRKVEAVIGQDHIKPYGLRRRQGNHFWQYNVLCFSGSSDVCQLFVLLQCLHSCTSAHLPAWFRHAHLLLFDSWKWQHHYGHRSQQHRPLAFVQPCPLRGGPSMAVVTAKDHEPHGRPPRPNNCWADWHLCDNNHLFWFCNWNESSTVNWHLLVVCLPIYSRFFSHVDPCGEIPGCSPPYHICGLEEGKGDQNQKRWHLLRLVAGLHHTSQVVSLHFLEYCHNLKPRGCFFLQPFCSPCSFSIKGEEADRFKPRAFYTIFVVLRALLFRYGFQIFSTVMLSFSEVDEHKGCVLWMSSFWFSVPSRLVAHLLFLHREGKRCCQNRRSGQWSLQKQELHLHVTVNK